MRRRRLPLHVVPNDNHPLWFRTARSILRQFWKLGVIGYVGDVSFNIVATLGNGGLSAFFNWNNFLHDLVIAQVVNAMIQYPEIAIPITLAVIFIVVPLSWWMHHHHMSEQQRRERQDRVDAVKEALQEMLPHLLEEHLPPILSQSLALVETRDYNQGHIKGYDEGFHAGFRAKPLDGGEISPLTRLSDSSPPR